jgi:hypothetical protein
MEAPRDTEARRLPSREGGLRLAGCAAMLLGVGLVTTGCGPNRASWVKENNRIINGIAVFPGAHERSRETFVMTGGIYGGTQGYYTVAKFALPAGTTLLEFRRSFAHHLPKGWSCRASGARYFDCSRGKAEADIGFYPSPSSYEINADKGHQDDKDAAS